LNPLSVLIVLYANDYLGCITERYTILLPQPSKHLALVTGTLSSINTPILEYAGLKIRKSDLIDLTTPGQTPIMVWEKELDRKQIEALKGILPGENARQGRPNIPRLCRYDYLFETGDAKTVRAVKMYEKAYAKGRIAEGLRDIRAGVVRT
tara:strand:- start:11253 stop:11705 length:453 start_codon:yes stop_codon:yes gene_type:complete